MKKICDLSDLEETRAFGAEVEGVNYVVALSPEDQQPRVYTNSCPHLGVQLEMLENQFLDPAGDYIVCANHGAMFKVDDGFCIAGPCMNQSLQSVDFKVVDEAVYLGH